MDQVSTLFLAISIMIIMAGMGLGLSLQDFKRVAENPKPVFMGLFNQIVLLPLVGFGLCLVFKPEPFIAIGMMMLVGLGDAIKAIDTSVIEVHISNTFAREDFRHTSYITPNAKGLILGFGMDSYRLAIESFIN